MNKLVLYVRETQWIHDWVKIKEWDSNTDSTQTEAFSFLRKLKNRFPDEKFCLVIMEVIGE